MSLSKNFNKILNTDIDKTILGYKNGGKWNWLTRNDMRNKVNYCVTVLNNYNIKPNDRIIFQGNNSYNWLAWNIATNSLGAIWVPMYKNQKDNYVKHIINDCQPKLFISSETLDSKKWENVDIISSKIDKNYADNQELTIKYNEIAKLIYTSGTTGKPKGVMLTHQNLLSNLDIIDKRFIEFNTDKQFTTLNILPWAHIYGLTTELYYNIFNNNRVAISSGPENFVKELREIQPELLYLVPRILQMIKQKLSFFDKPIIKSVLPLLLDYIFGKNLITIFVGGAQLDEHTKNFYKDNEIILCEGYGCTETSPMISVNHLNNHRNEESIGKILDDYIIKIINQEILVSGPSVMKGYWNNEIATNDVLKEIDGNIYYKTGDQGYVKDNFLFYNGRVKENYKLNNGKFVNVNELDNIIKKHIMIPFMIYGNNRSYNIIILEKENNIDINDFLEKINSEISSYARIKDVLLVEKGTFEKFYTPKLSLKRNELEKFLEDQINKFYSN